MALMTSVRAVAASPVLPDPEENRIPEPTTPGFLTGPAQGDPLDIALAYLNQHRPEFGLRSEDLADILLTDRYVSRHNGVTHIYLRQRYQGLEIYGANLNVNVTADGQIVNMGVRFAGGVAGKINTTRPGLNAAQGVSAAADHLGLRISGSLQPQGGPHGPAQEITFNDAGISRKPIAARLVYVPLGNQLRLAWEIEIYERSALHWWFVQVDAGNGQILGKSDIVVHDRWGPAETTGSFSESTASPLEIEATAGAGIALSSLAAVDGASYKVYSMPVESPIHTSPAPPADARSVVVDPAHAAASPFGWHDTNGVAGPEFTTTQGNNVHAYTDHNGNNQPDGGSSPDGGAGLTFSASLDLTQSPQSYADAAVINLFYWNNLVHDISFLYGFDEAAGNFQEYNYSASGLGSDYVLAEAQDEANKPNVRNNANFATPVDGQNPRMQMYLWDYTSPERDGDLDSGIIAHEYGHGISNRLIGGPSNERCLENDQQMGEGWSDWQALIMTMKPGDTGPQGRGIGTYGYGQPPDGLGIRPARYSTDLAVNAYTYNDLSGLAVPHGVGFLWATMLWEMNWALIGQHGFNPDLTGDWTTGGNNLAHQLVMDGMKLVSCNPGFVDGRDAILAADQLLTGGANQCLIWEAFAKRGLGQSADQGGWDNTSTNTEAFDIPSACQETLHIDKTADPSSLAVGQLLTYTLTARNATTITLNGVTITDTVPSGSNYEEGSATCGGIEAGGVLTFTLGSLNAGQSTACSFQVIAGDASTITLFIDDGESGSGSWNPGARAGAGSWSLVAVNPNSPSHAWFAPDEASISDLVLETASPIPIGIDTELRFWHDYDSEANWDGGVVEVKTEGGYWTDVGPLMTQNGYNGTINKNPDSAISGREAFTGDSLGYLETAVDLSSYAGQAIYIRFRMVADGRIGGAGWYVDDVSVSGRRPLFNTACVSAVGGYGDCDAVVTAVLLGSPLPAPTLLNPADSAVISDTTPAFSWTAVISAAQYQLQVDNNAGFSSTEIDITTAITGYTPTTHAPGRGLLLLAGPGPGRHRQLGILERCFHLHHRRDPAGPAGPSEPGLWLGHQRYHAGIDLERQFRRDRLQSGSRRSGHRRGRRDPVDYIFLGRRPAQLERGRLRRFGQHQRLHRHLVFYHRHHPAGPACPGGAG